MSQQNPQGQINSKNDLFNAGKWEIPGKNYKRQCEIKYRT